MRNKKIFSFDEEKDAIEVIANGFANKCINYSKMYLVAKYLRQKFSYGEIRLERELIRFCLGQDKNFNPITEAETIKKWVKTAMEYKLRTVDTIYISEGEQKFLREIDSPKDRKILFVTLVLAKALKQKSTKVHNLNPHVSNNFYIRYSNLLDIIRLSEIKGLTEIGLADILSKYKDYFEFYSAEKELIKLKYAEESLCGFEIIDFYGLVAYYEILFGKNKTYCTICGKDYNRVANNQRVCSECAKEIKRKQSYDRKIRWRSKQNRKI